jgi:autotransporter-associated beta strand protein
MYQLFTQAPGTALHHHVRITPGSAHSFPRLVRNTILQTILVVAASILASTVAHAGSATWDLNPASGDWNTPANWTPMTVPNGPGDIATFAFSNSTGVLISANTEVNAITFTPAATIHYTITANPDFTLTMSGVGLRNNSGISQNFVAAVDGAGNLGHVIFVDSATAGTSTIFINSASAAQFVQGGDTAFYNTSTAANGTFANQGGTLFGSQGGTTSFYDSSTAGNGNFTNSAGITFDTFSAATVFNNTSTAANGVFTNEGGAANFADGGQTIFFDASIAANGTFIDNGATVSGGFGGATVFDYSASAGHGSFTNNGGTPSGVFALGGGNTIFLKNSTAAHGTFVNNGATTSDGEGGVTELGIFPSGNLDSPTAAHGIFINNGATISGAVGGKTVFYETAAADFATLIANSGTGGGGGGEILFFESSAGGRPRVELFGNGSLDVSGHDAPGVTIGSIEGEGDVFLGANNLTVGSNNLSTAFLGVIQDGGVGSFLAKIAMPTFNLTETKEYPLISTINRGVLKAYDSISNKTFAIQDGGFGGSFTKIGNGALELEGINTYTGDTIVNRGLLQVNGSITSNTFVNDRGTLAGTGTVYGSIVNSNGGTVSPGDALGTLTVDGNYTQTARGSLVINIVGPNAGEFSVLDVSGIASLNGGSVFLDPVLLNGFVPRVGQSFAFLNYASLAGVFSIRHPNIPHGIGHWEVIYQGTAAILTVAPGHS